MNVEHKLHSLFKNTRETTGQASTLASSPESTASATATELDTQHEDMSDSTTTEYTYKTRHARIMAQVLGNKHHRKVVEYDEVRYLIKNTPNISLVQRRRHDALLLGLEQKVKDE